MAVVEALFVLIPLGFLIGWALGIAGFVQARHARREVAELRAALAAAARGEAPLQAAANPWAAREQGAATAELPPAEPAAATAESEPEAADSAPSTAPSTRPSLEEMLTLRWGVWLGAAALLLAAVFLVRTAVEEGWLGPAARCALAGLLGFALIGAGEWLARRPFARRIAAIRPDQAPPALTAGGVAALFGAAYAAAVLYALVPPLLGFAGMAGAGLLGLLLSLRRGPLVAAVGLVGAFITPLLVEAQDPSAAGLFAYLLVVTAAAMAVVRHTAWGWLGWCATVAGAVWVLLATEYATGLDAWATALFVPAAAALNLFLLPGEALDHALGRRLSWVPMAALGAALLPVASQEAEITWAAGVLLLSPVAMGKAWREPRLDRLPWLAAALGLVLLAVWAVPPWSVNWEGVMVEGQVMALIPGPWPPRALLPYLMMAALLAGLHLIGGLWQERRAEHPLHWAALAAGVPVLALLLAYARVSGFATDAGWGLAALGLAALLIAAAARARGEEDAQRAGVHAAGATAAIALGVAMVLREHWLTLALSLFLPVLAVIAERTGLRPLRRVALAVAGVVLARLLLNEAVLDYGHGTAPVLNGLLAAYGVPALAFALAARGFGRQGRDMLVGVLEAGALALVTALAMLEIRHYATRGNLRTEAWALWEAGLQASVLLILAVATLWLDRRLRRPVLAFGWRAQAAMGVLLGLWLVVANPAFTGKAVGELPIANALLPAYLLPALLAGALTALEETRRPAWLRPLLAAEALAAGFAWVTLEIRHAFHPGAIGFGRVPVEEAELWAWSGAWLVLGGLLLWLGIRTGGRALRLAALALVGLTTVKVFIVDMGALVGLWRVLSFLGLGLALIALGAVYQRFVLPPRATPGPEEAPPA